MPRLTVAAAEQALRRMVTGGHVIVRRHVLHRATAQVDVSNHPHLILIDPVRGAALDCLIHELIHVAFLEKLAEWGALEEEVVLALEDRIVRHINRSPARVAWWRKKLDRLLNE
jgi:hypothetical protein